MSKMFSPPLWMGHQSVAIAILGFIPWSQMNLLMVFDRVSSMCDGIPWALAKNWVCPPIIACMTTCFPLSVRCALSHMSSFDLITSSISSQGVWLLASFPIHTPSILVASPSRAILIFGGKVVVLGVDFPGFHYVPLVGSFPYRYDFGFLNIESCS